MAKPIATINNIPVYSDKQVMGIFNTLVKFMDGSYADVSTGEVVNKGAGYISIGSVPTENSKRKRIQKTFSARDIEVLELSANVNIQPHDGEVEVAITAPESVIEEISLSQADNLVTIKGQGKSNSGGINISGGNISIVGGVIRSGNIQIGGMSRGSINIGGNEPEIEISVKVPFKANVEVSDIEGKVVIGNIRGNLRANINGVGEVNAGEMNKVIGKISGSGTLIVQSVTGDLKVKVSGSGDVKVNGGNISDLEASVSGSGDVHINAEAQTADLDVSGSGDIYIRKVVAKPRKHISGVGEIRVGNW